jgi:hypothetical protein
VVELLLVFPMTHVYKVGHDGLQWWAVMERCVEERLVTVSADDGLVDMLCGVAPLVPSDTCGHD